MKNYKRLYGDIIEEDNKGMRDKDSMENLCRYQCQS